MRDRYSNERAALLHKKARQTFINFIEECEAKFDITLRISMGYRSIEEQNKLYAQGRTTPGDIVTNAKGGSSYHNYGLAVDLCEVTDNGQIDWKYDMAKLAPIAHKYNLEWGGAWHHIVDRPHFEMRMGFKEDCSDIPKYFYFV